MESKDMAEYTLTAKEAAEVIGVSGSTIRRYVMLGKLTGLMRAGAWFFKPEMVNGFKRTPRGKPKKK
jgi:excisionase family DNA binding protein